MFSIQFPKFYVVKVLYGYNTVPTYNLKITK